MKYIDVLKKERAAHVCPFCHIHPDEIVFEGKHFLVIPARAPYIKHHLLIIPKRHANTLATLTSAEHKELHLLIDTRAQKLHAVYKDVSLLLRDGLVRDTVLQKSVNHLHFHLLPNMAVEIQDQKSSENRERLEDKVYTKTAQAIKKKFL